MADFALCASAHSAAGSLETAYSNNRLAFNREGRFGTRTIRITAIDEDQLHDTVSTVSRVSSNGHGARV